MIIYHQLIIIFSFFIFNFFFSIFIIYIFYNYYIKELNIILYNAKKDNYKLWILYQKKLLYISKIKNKIYSSDNSINDNKLQIKNMIEEDIFNILKENNKKIISMNNVILFRWIESFNNKINIYQNKVINLIYPIKESINKINRSIGNIEYNKENIHHTLINNIHFLMDIYKELKIDIHNINKVFDSSNYSGQWGEIQLKKIIELSGMMKYCDFIEQKEANKIKPDLIINLPNNKYIVIDSKAPINSYLKISHAKNNSDKQVKIKNYIMQIKKCINNLSHKAYWKQFKGPEYVILFLPGESLLSTAIFENPSIFEEGFNKGVIITTPTILITLLKSIAFSWREESMSTNLKEIFNIICILCKDTYKLREYFLKLGQNLHIALDNYNKTLRDLDVSILSNIKKLANLSILDKNNIIKK